MTDAIKIPRTISHYTTIPGLMGIVRSRCLWASNVSFLNDRTELLHALDVAQTSIEQLTSTKAMKKWSVTLDDVVKQLKDGKIPDTFVTCFCQDDDNLSQWRGYGGQEQGISITFDTSALNGRLKSNGAKLYRVIYARILTAKKLRDALKYEISDIADLEDILGAYSKEEKHKEVFARVSNLLPKFKHYGFRDEREWRFVVQRSTPDEALEFRAGKNRVVPYIELGKTDTPLPIVSVRVGPGDDQSLTALSLKRFLEDWGHEDAAIHVSDIPFRN